MNEVERTPVQDTEFVQPALGEKFEMGKKKAREVLQGLDQPRDGTARFAQGSSGVLAMKNS